MDYNCQFLASVDADGEVTVFYIFVCNKITLVLFFSLVFILKSLIVSQLQVRTEGRGDVVSCCTEHVPREFSLHGFASSGG